ncbi:alpha/beta fold hydrolase [Rhodoplanes azumiensis]|uniref:Alpha/beta fold hydrolase n=1 Tax=Rhodoplanes azumiensis TaxID=1897628 RepID=A0ABW5AM94_9BRAD
MSGVARLLETTASPNTAIVGGRADGIAYLHRPGRETAVPVVLLHGIGSDAASFVPLMGALDARFDVIAWDAPGYGTSAPLAPAWPSAADYAERLAALLTTLDGGPAIVVGHSLGALMAASYARSKPQQVAGVLLLSPAVGYGVVPGGDLPESVAARLSDLDRLGPEEFARLRAPRLVADVTVLPAVTRAMASVRMPGYGQASRMLGCGRLLDDLAALTCPVLVACGAEDRITPPAQSATVARAVAPAGRIRDDLVLVDGAGHALPQERPDVVAGLIAGLAAHPGSDGEAP